MATIYKRLTEDGKVRYTAYIRLKGHPRQSQTFDRKADAIRWAKQHETAVQTGRYLLSPEASKRTLADLIDRYTEYVLPDLPASARDYARHLCWWKEQLGSYYLSDISPRLVDDYKQKLLREPGPKGKRSNATVNRYLTTLSAMYTYGMSPAVSWVTQHVVRTVGRKEEPRGRVRFLSRPVDEQDSELERLLAACKQSRNPDLYDLVVIALYTGMRQGELMAIRRSWIRLDMDSPGISLPAMATQRGGLRGRLRLAGQPGHPLLGEDRVHPRQAVPLDGPLCLKLREAELLPGSARGLVPSAVFSVSLPCHWRRRFGGSRQSEAEGNRRREAVVSD